MLRNTFLHIPGVGPKTERNLWEKKAFSWSGFTKSNGYGIPQKTAKRITEYLVLSENALRRKEVQFFSRTLPKSEWWRLYPEFKNSTAFLDIETTGLSFYYNNVTLIGLFNGKEFKVYIRGQNLPDFKDEIGKYSLLVTYNGTLFDLPFLSSEFGEVNFPSVHIDLRFLLRRLGYTGGLKSLEKQLGISRQSEVVGIDGFGATILWNRYTRGDLDALKLLLQYNFADVTNLEVLMELSYSMMRGRILSGLGHWPTNQKIPPPDAKLTRKLFTSVWEEIYSNHNNCRATENSVSIETLLMKLNGRRGSPPKVVGIDLRASDVRKSGVALMKGELVETGLVEKDGEIVDLMLKWKPDLISIDSPLSLPKGRDCVSDECECRKFGITRECERILRSRNINVFWCLIQSMQGLTERGMRLAQQLRKLGFDVIESYPGAAQDILGITRKKVSTEELKQGLIDFGLAGLFEHNKITHDELDAITSALVGYFYLSGCFEALGNESEGYLIIPSIRAVYPPKPLR
jgi:uncharacterized protein YprB with RNaseH-like and TPR domain/predicted nuclease with RNAse H fold